MCGSRRRRHLLLTLRREQPDAPSVGPWQVTRLFQCTRQRVRHFDPLAARLRHEPDKTGSFLKRGRTLHVQPTPPPHHHFVSAAALNELSDSPSVGTHSAITDGTDCARATTARPVNPGIEALVERFLSAEHDLAAAVDAAGGRVPLPDGRTVSTGRAEFDAVPGWQRRRAWVVIRKNAPMPPRR